MTDSLEDLSARARRGMLDENERRRLKLLLGASVEGRLLHDAGSHFDAEDSVLPGDDGIAARIVDRVLARGAKAPAERRRRPTWLLVALAACLVSAATAGAATQYRRQLAARLFASIPAQAPADRGSVHPPSRVGAGAVADPIRDREPAVSAANPEPTPIVSAASAPVPIPLPSLSNGASDLPHGATAPSSADLFAHAARARRDGSLDEAVRLYGSLQRRYPVAPESRAADIALGMIQLGRGAAGASLEHFQHYLRHSPDGDLVPEALWGEAEAMRKVGRSDDAQSVLSSLLARFPDSAYAAAARSRLEPPKSAP